MLSPRGLLVHVAMLAAAKVWALGSTSGLRVHLVLEIHCTADKGLRGTHPAEPTLMVKPRDIPELPTLKPPG